MATLETKEGIGMTKRTRILSALLAAAVALVLLSSALYLIAEADHDCSGPDCAVCQQLSSCVQALKSLALAAGAVSAVLVLGRAASQAAPASVLPAQRRSLVSLKVKLTD